MIIYISMLLISLFFSYISQKTTNKKVSIFFAVMSALPFVIVSSIRYDVGTDYLYRYAKDYNVLLNGGDVSNLEIGFKMLNKFCILITNNYQAIFILTSVIINGLIFYIMYRDSRNVQLSIVLYFVGAFFFQSLNLTRQYISISIILFSYRYFLDRNWVKWGICIAIAFIFHTTSLIIAITILIMYFMGKIFKKDILMDRKIFFLILFLLFCSGPLLEKIIDFALTYTRFNIYLKSKFNYGDLQIIPFIINILLYVWMTYITRLKKYKISEIEKFFINMQALVIIFIVLGKTSVLTIRLVYYFSIFQIISITYFLKYVRDLYNTKVYKMTIFVIIIVFSITLLWTHILHTSDEVLPYKTIFDKEYEFK